MLGSNQVNHNFTESQLKGILRELTKQLDKLERQGDKQEVRAKMLDIAHYNSMYYNMVDWNTYSSFQDELDLLR